MEGGVNYIEDRGIRLYDPYTLEPIPRNSKRGRELMAAMDKYEKNKLPIRSNIGVDLHEKREEEREDSINHDYYLNCVTGEKIRIKHPTSTRTPHVNQLIEIERIGRNSTIQSEKVEHNIQEIEVKKEPIESKWKTWLKK